jgi:hypothetical protein
VLVNNASIFEYDNTSTRDAPKLGPALGSNLRAPFLLIQALAAQAPDPVPDARGEPVARRWWSTWWTSASASSRPSS